MLPMIPMASTIMANCALTAVKILIKKVSQDIAQQKFTNS